MTERLLGFIPARSGSKRVADKNLRPCAGESLIARTVRCALSVPALDGIGFSSDSPAYVAEARAAGLSVDYLRPAELATDEAGSAAVVVDYLDWLDRRDAGGYTHVVLLQPTSPLRRPADVVAAIRQWRASGRPSLVSVCPAAPDPRFLVRRTPDRGLVRLDQGLDPVYVLEGSIYITPVDMLRTRGKFWDDDSEAFVLSHPRPYDIDTEADFAAAEALLRSQRKETAC